MISYFHYALTTEGASLRTFNFEFICFSLFALACVSNASFVVASEKWTTNIKFVCYLLSPFEEGCVS
jgi:hypothetical protein